MTEQLLFTITTGRTPTLGVCCMPNSGYAVTVDIEGMCSRWDLHRIQNIAGDDGLVANFFVTSQSGATVQGASSCRPTSMVMFSATTGTIVLGARKLYIFDQQSKAQAESSVVDLV